MIPPLWSDDQVEEREDGYLILKDGFDPPMEQPLLLHSAEIFLKNLYPDLSREAILACFPVPLSESESSTEEDLTTGLVSEEKSSDDMEVDNSDDDDGGNDERSHEANTEIKPKGLTGKSKNKGSKEVLKYQQVYQSLQRCENLSTRIQNLVSDLKSFKHRPIKQGKDAGRSSREKIKVRALELQQQKLLQKQSTIDSGTDALLEMDPENDQQNNDADVSDEESHIVRLVRGINSIRAIYMHIFQIFNHKRRNDKLLTIGDGKWQSKKRGFCWILGSQVYDWSSSKLIIGAYKDCSLILESFISVEAAKTICRDPFGGSPTFWSKSWIQEVKTRATPIILDPLTILTSFPNAPDREAIQQRCTMCEEFLHLESSDANAEQIQAQYDAAVRKLHQKISELLKERFPEARISIYGSCLSNLSLGKGADVDLSLWLPKAEELRADFEQGRLEASIYEKRMKSFVFQVFHKLKNFGQMFRDLQPVTRARVPVVKGTYNFAKNPYSQDGSLSFDICFLNEIAVANSGLVREYTLIEPRIRKLLMEVKHFAKDRDMNSAKDGFISSYAWVNLVVFYLQCVGSVPNLQDPVLMKQVDFVPDPARNLWHSVNNLETWYLRWDQVKDSWSPPPHLADASVAELLYGFFEFYSRRFPSAVYAVSIKQGGIKTSKLDSRKAALFYSIEDPFETYDSYCPHDLSSPAGEAGTRDMLEYFYAAENHLRGILLGESDSSTLWPSYGNSSQKEASEKTERKIQASFTRIPIDEKAGLEVVGSIDQASKQNSDGGPGRGGGTGRGPKGRGSGHRKSGRGGRGDRGQGGRGDHGQNAPRTSDARNVQSQTNQQKGSNNLHKEQQGGDGSSYTGEGGSAEAGPNGNNRDNKPKGKRAPRRRPPQA